MQEGDSFEVSFETEQGHVRVFHLEDEAGDTVRVLQCGDTFESASYLGDRYCEPYFEYIKRFDLIFRAKLPITKLLMLGGGAFSYPKHLFATHPDISMDVVEIDEIILDIARDFFGLDDCIEQYRLEESGRLGIIVDDGRRYLEQMDTCYDAIINDAFVRGDAVASLADERAAQLFARHLNPGGVFAVNVVAALEGRASHSLREQLSALRSAFAHVWLVPLGADEPKVPDNNIVLACNDSLDIPEAYRL